MRYTEIINEYGRHAFPGFGRGLFKQGFYEFIANSVHTITDDHAREFVTNWFADAFARDNGSFKPDLFRKACENGIRSRANPTFQQRHLYYLAQLINDISDAHVRAFMTDWVGKEIRHTNPSFNVSIWEKVCNKGHDAPNQGEQEVEV